MYLYIYIYCKYIYIYINYTYIHIYKYRDATFCGFRHWLGRFQVCSGGHWLPIKESNRLKLVMFISFTTWRCPKLGYPEIGNFNRMFHDINHPAILGYNSQPYPRKVASLLAKPVTTFAENEGTGGLCLQSLQMQYRLQYRWCMGMGLDMRFSQVGW